jgi:hypothetical protein
MSRQSDRVFRLDYTSIFRADPTSTRSVRKSPVFRHRRISNPTKLQDIFGGFLP